MSDRSVSVNLGGGHVALLEPDVYLVDRELLEDLATPAGPESPEPVRAPELPVVREGRYDQGARRRTQRRGRERGCWVYIPAAELVAAGVSPDDEPPWYRLWSGRRGRFIVTLYREP